MPKVKKNKRNESKILNDITTRFKEVTDDPTQFLLVVPPNKQEDIKSLLQKTYEACMQNDEGSKSTSEILPELVVEDMDEEQIWQQLELRNNVLLSTLIENTSKLLSLREEKLEVRLNEDEENEDNEEEDLRESDNDLEEDNEENNLPSEDEDDENEPEVLRREKEFKKKRKARSSVVDDKFFKLSEMEAFLEEEDAKEMGKKKKSDYSIDEGIDYFADDLGLDDDEDDEDETNPSYKDFFDEDEEDEEQVPKKTVKKQKDHFKEDASEEEEIEKEVDEYTDEDGENENVGEKDDEDADSQQNDDENGDSENEGISTKEALQPASSGSDDSEGDAEQDEEQAQSSFQVREARLQQRMREYEDIVLGEKPWQLRGEVQATSRPHNSLLEEILEFESTVRPPPIITENTTRRLEDIIKQRIRDKAWDDPVYTLKPVQTPHDFRKQLILDQEKSKESLAQVYEKEYQKELDKFDPNRGDAAEEEPKEHKEIKRLMRALFVKLDALSNFHFTPKPVAPEARILTNTPAVTMEEVAPVAVSDAKLLAPEEVYRGPKNGLLGKSERNRTDKNRERRKKKQKQRVIHRLLEEKNKKKQEMGIAPTKKEESAKLLKSLTKHRNVEKLNTTSDDQRALKSSKSFFSKLQDTTSGTGQAATAAKAKKQKSTGKNITAKRVKL